MLRLTRRNYWHHRMCSGPGSSVRIATGYGLGCPGIELRWKRDFPQLSRLDLRPTQPSVQWVTGLSWGWRAAGAWRWPLIPFYCRGQWKSRAIPLLPRLCRTACTEPQCLYKGAPYPSPPSSDVVKKEYSYTSTTPMGRAACTEPQCLYKSPPYPSPPSSDVIKKV